MPAYKDFRTRPRHRIIAKRIHFFDQAIEDLAAGRPPGPVHEPDLGFISLLKHLYFQKHFSFLFLLANMA
jgi:hypothetical protein